MIHQCITFINAFSVDLITMDKYNVTKMVYKGK